MSHFNTSCEFKQGLLAGADMEQASRTLKSIAHPLRLQILCRLGNEEMSVQDIVGSVGTSQSNISQHLAVMRDKGALSCRKEANKVFYRITSSAVLRMVSTSYASQ
ncbi:MAG: winged helix-turn-helix transcriptional regulator [Thiotrichaceae bacterium]|nr:winged helix-turn-helix transcriptional regulator [Thiotrichaceae bacterium]